jgi:ferredoxin
MWEAFTKAGLGGHDPLDRWSRRVLDTIATQLDASVVMPSDGPPFNPFQRWAMRAEPVHSSPLGILIHPRWGLWHGYRGALLFAEVLDLPDVEVLESPCVTCEAKPCLTTCPVGAFTGSEYRVEACATHLNSAAGTRCLTGGCLARHACPIGKDARPGSDQAAFHMRAFLFSHAN